MTKRTVRGRTGLLAAGCLGMTGCTMSMGGGMYGPPRPASRPVMSPTAGYYAPSAPQVVNGPVAVAPIPVSADNSLVPNANLSAASASIASAPAATTAIGPRTVATYYHIVPGDTLSSIAQRYQTTVDALRNANKLNGNNDLVPGQTVLIPNAGTVIR